MRAQLGFVRSETGTPQLPSHLTSSQLGFLCGGTPAQSGKSEEVGKLPAPWQTAINSRVIGTSNGTLLCSLKGKSKEHRKRSPHPNSTYVSRSKANSCEDDETCVDRP